MKNIEFRRILIMYGDVTGFCSWSRRVQKDAVRSLLRDAYDLYGQWETETGFWMKYEGDGFIAVRELQPCNDRERIIRVLRKAWEITQKMNRLLKALPYPRPFNFRMRVVVGEELRMTKNDGDLDYAGDNMNLGRRLLDIAKDEPIIIAESVFDALKRRGCRHIRFRRLCLGELHLPGVALEDQRNFWAYEFHK